MSLNLYSFFHLNIAYSAIEEEDRPHVIEKCYWPLLKLVAKHDFKFGIELSAYTLETILSIDPKWIKEFSRLILKGSCELIGCGYSQIIGPLVPAEITIKNLDIGSKIYKKILGVEPKVALLNEQAFSKGLVELYKEAGYDAIIMEWDNPYRDNFNWKFEWSYLPQRAKGNGSNEIHLIWNKSISFQKFQRYVHGEIELSDLLKYIRSNLNSNQRAFSVYGNDVEIFDFRPGRYMTEADIQGDGEWKRISSLYKALAKEKKMKFVKPSEVIKLKSQPGANKLLDLNSAAQPIPVKKQDKYNIVRWAVTGRDDLKINTLCWRIFESLQNSSNVDDQDWRELCYLWSSDFRTHITEKRWKKYIKRLRVFFDKKNRNTPHSRKNFTDDNKTYKLSKSLIFKTKRVGRFLEIFNRRFKIVLNCKRGLALESFKDKLISNKPIIGTVEHGYFKDIRYSADYYSGHFIFESPGKHKITDLNSVNPKIQQLKNGLKISSNIFTPMGLILKKWVINNITGQLNLSYKFNWKESVVGTMRLGYITLLPNAFDKKTLYFQTHNGGKLTEHFKLKGQKNFDHGKTVSSLISANQAISISNGIVEIGDVKKKITLRYKKTQASLIGLISNMQIHDENFFRLAFSLREVDDTSRPAPVGLVEINFEISIS